MEIVVGINAFEIVPLSQAYIYHDNCKISSKDIHQLEFNSTFPFPSYPFPAYLPFKSLTAYI